VKHPQQSQPEARGSIHADELLDLRTFGKRLGLGPRVLCDLQRAGMKTVTLGRKKFVVGKWVLDFAERQAAGGGQGGGGDG
jgi:hypothetical protein